MMVAESAEGREIAILHSGYWKRIWGLTLFVDGGILRPVDLEVPLKALVALRPLGKNRPRPLLAPRVKIWMVCTRPSEGLSQCYDSHVA